MAQKNRNIATVKPGGLELKDRLVGVQRVTKVTKGGRAFGFSAIVVVGNEDGVVGHGLGKSKEVATAIAKAVEDAKKNLIRIPLNKGTLPHEQKGKFGGARVYIQPASIENSTDVELTALAAAAVTGPTADTNYMVSNILSRSSTTACASRALTGGAGA